MKALSLTITVLVSGCVADLDGENVEVSEQYTRPACDDWGCGMNSPYVDNFGFHSFRQDGAPGEQGLTLGPLVKNGIEYQLTVTDGRIIGRKSGYPPLVFSGATSGLVGSTFTLQNNGEMKYVIKIAAASHMKSWAVKNGVALTIETYHLLWRGADEKFYNLCADDTTADGMTAFHAVVFEGDVVEAATKTVKPKIDDRIVNIGCAGSTLAKMALIAHTEVADRAGFSTSIDERTTALKMFAADYCGTGRAFTVGGQPLQYSDNHNWFNAQTNFLTRVEALWDVNGAVCLNMPRTLRQPSDLAEVYFSDVEDQIADECVRPPPCRSGTSPTSPSPYHLVSTNQIPIIPL